jgi:16S rRNA (cytosine967-C5)-methyltransferase
LARTPWAPGAAALAAAAYVVDAVVGRGQSAGVALALAVPRARDAEPAAVRAIALGTLRWYLRLAPAIEALLARPSGVPGPTRSLLIAAAHQVEYSRNAPEATVHAAVDAARLLDASRLTGLVNGVLRRFVAERALLLEPIDATLSGRTAHPAWLVSRACAAWPLQCVQLLEANNVHPPMTLRVDLTRLTAADYLARLAEASIDAYEIRWMPSAVTLNQPTDVGRLPGFADGDVSVQDAAAQLASRLLDVRPGMAVLDACAAPGGKTGHLLELLDGTGEVTAIDIDPARVELIEQNLRRLGRAARLFVADARDPSTFWDGRPYERILVDAPCSSTGVIRRHPDIKLLRRAADLEGLRAMQLAVLRAAVPLLAPGGRLLYSTCSILPEENEQLIAELLAAEPGMGVRALAASVAPGALERAVGVQLLPGAEAGTDGFYYACLEKTTTGA